MSKIKIAVCSNSAIDFLDYPKSIDIFRCRLHFGEETFDDYVDMKPAEFYERIKKDPDNLPKTSFTSPGMLLEAFENYEKQGYTDVIFITIAKPLSGFSDAVKRLASEVNINVISYDSKTIAYPESLMAITAQNLADKGAQLPEILEAIDFIRDNNKMYFAVDTLLYLVKNGRLSKLSGTLGSLLSIKPVLSFSKDGHVVTLEKIRTSKKALRRIVDLYLEDTKDKDVETFIAHAHNDEGAKQITEMIHEVYPNRIVNSAYLTPVIGAHTGPNAIAIGYILKK